MHLHNFHAEKAMISSTLQMRFNSRLYIKYAMYTDLTAVFELWQRGYLTDDYHESCFLTSIMLSKDDFKHKNDLIWRLHYIINNTWCIPTKIMEQFINICYTFYINLLKERGNSL